MSPSAAEVEPRSLDELELELRQLPGVRGVGFVLDNPLVVRLLHVHPDHEGLRRSARQLAGAHLSFPVTVEVEQLGGPPGLLSETGSSRLG